MLSCCTNYLTDMPTVSIYMNCDTRLAINLRLFEMAQEDAFIFTIKNYDYIDSPYVFAYVAYKTDIDEETGEIIFSIPPETSKNIKPGAFYNFTLLTNARSSDKDKPKEYKKLTKNGNIKIEYGAQALDSYGELPNA